MLGRLLKYEIKATARIFIPIYFVVLMASFFFLFVRNANDDFLTMKMIMSIIIAIGYLATWMAWMFITIGRFYQTMFTNEGYLTHTLPVSVNQLVLSKLMISIFWYILGTAIFTFVALFAQPGISHTLGENFVLKLTSSYITFTFIASTESLLIFSMLIYASLSIAQMFHTVKNKFLMAALIVIVTSLLYQLLMTGLYHLFPDILGSLFQSVIAETEYEAIMRHFISLGFGINVIVFSVLYLTTIWCLKHRLNLE